MVLSRATRIDLAIEAGFVRCQDRRDFVLQIVDRDLVDRAVRDIRETEIEDRCPHVPCRVRSSVDSSATVLSSTSRSLATSRRSCDSVIGIRPAARRPAMTRSPDFVAQIQLLAGVARGMGVAERVHQRRA